MVTPGKKRAFKGRKAKAVYVLILLVPEVGIPSIDSGQAPRHGVEAPRDFESENRVFANILKAASLNILKILNVITDALRDDQKPLKAVLQKTDYENIDLVPANLSLGGLENELISERDSHYCLVQARRDRRRIRQVLLISC
jgi:hypothetical protein